MIDPWLTGALALVTGVTALALHHRSRLRKAFLPTHHLWSRGLALLCDHNGGIDFVRSQIGGQPPPHLDPHEFERVKDGDLVWMRASFLPQFIDKALPRIAARFTLVTGDEDWSIPSDFVRARELLEDPRLLAGSLRTSTPRIPARSYILCRSVSISTRSPMPPVGVIGPTRHSLRKGNWNR